MRLIITGTPGTGKTSISKGLAKELGCEAVEVNRLIRERKLYSHIENGEHVADFGKLGKLLRKMLRKEKSIILESHLLSDLKLPCDLVIVMRCEPDELAKRLRKRGYPVWKVNDNVMSEALDYCLINAIHNFGMGKVLQIVATRKCAAKTALWEIKRFKKTRKMKQVRWLKNMPQEKLLEMG
ncbi:MAG: adenylate kinase family protein [Candidatus Micrarchaeota archaeon]